LEDHRGRREFECSSVIYGFGYSNRQDFAFARNARDALVVVNDRSRGPGHRRAVIVKGIGRPRIGIR